MTLFALAGLSLSIFCFGLALFILKFAKLKLHYLWAIFNAVVGLWGFCIFLAGSAKTPERAIFNFKIVYSSASFIPILFYHFVYCFCHLKKKRMLIFAYAQGIFFLPLIIFSPDFVNTTAYLYNSIYYSQATLLFNIWITIFLSITFLSFYELFKFIKTISGSERAQALYIFWGMALGWIGGLTTFLPSYNINFIYPAWHFTICIYAIIMTYAIFRYQLMDMKIAVTRLGIFILVYSLILGIPYGLTFWGKDYLSNTFGNNWYWIPLIVTTLFATAGPFLYLYFQRKAEDQLFKEQRRYQSTLREASRNMGRIKDIHRLSRFLVYIVMRAVRLRHASVYIWNNAQNGFVLSAGRNHSKILNTIAVDSPLVKYLKEDKRPIVYDDLKQSIEGDGSVSFAEICASLEKLNAALIVPNIIQDRILGILILGPKRSGKPFSEDDLSAFSILANQAALAMENLKSVEEMKKTQEKLFHTEKLAYVGQLASSVVHEVRNPLTAIKTFVECLPEKFRSQDFNFLERFEAIIPREVHRIEKILYELLDLAKPRQTRKSEIKVSKIVQTTLDLLKENFQLKRIRVENQCSTPNDKILGDEEQIQQVILNLILNALDAMPEGGDLSIKICRIAQGAAEQDQLMITVRDTGSGIPKDQLKELFTPFRTTKKDGVGLGLVITQEIVKAHGGTIQVESESGRGTQFTMIFPAA